MSKHTAHLVRYLVAATFIASVSAPPAFAKASASPETFPTKASTEPAAKTVVAVQTRDVVAMNVVLACVRSGSRMVC
jgi:hypothetical protein